MEPGVVALLAFNPFVFDVSPFTDNKSSAILKGNHTIPIPLIDIKRGGQTDICNIMTKPLMTILRTKALICCLGLENKDSKAKVMETGHNTKGFSVQYNTITRLLQQ